jgi:hypothetical protein
MLSPRPAEQVSRLPTEVFIDLATHPVVPLALAVSLLALASTAPFTEAGWFALAFLSGYSLSGST